MHIGTFEKQFVGYILLLLTVLYTYVVRCIFCCNFKHHILMQHTFSIARKDIVHLYSNLSSLWPRHCVMVKQIVFYGQGIINLYSKLSSMWLDKTLCINIVTYFPYAKLKYYMFIQLQDKRQM